MTTYHVDTDNELRTRLDEVEARFTFLDDHIQQLNMTIAQQQREIEGLRIKLDHLAKQVRSLSAHELASEGEEPPPPHY